MDNGQLNYLETLEKIHLHTFLNGALIRGILMTNFTELYKK